MRKLLLFILGFVMFFFALHFFTGITDIFTNEDISESDNHPGFFREFNGIRLGYDKMSYYDSTNNQIKYSLSYNNISTFSDDSNRNFIHKNNQKFEVFYNQYTGAVILPITKNQYENSKKVLVIVEKIFQLSLFAIAFFMFRIVLSINQNPFSQNNLKYIKNISWIVVIIGIISFFQNVIISLYLRIFLNYQTFLFDTNKYDIIPYTIILGLFLFSILYIYKKGIELNNEQSLTI